MSIFWLRLLWGSDFLPTLRSLLRSSSGCSFTMVHMNSGGKLAVTVIEVDSKRFSTKCYYCPPVPLGDDFVVNEASCNSGGEKEEKDEDVALEDGEDTDFDREESGDEVSNKGEMLTVKIKEDLEMNPVIFGNSWCYQNLGWFKNFETRPKPISLISESEDVGSDNFRDPVGLVALAITYTGVLKVPEDQLIKSARNDGNDGVLADGIGDSSVKEYLRKRRRKRKDGLRRRLR